MNPMDASDQPQDPANQAEGSASGKKRAVPDQNASPLEKWVECKCGRAVGDFLVMNNHFMNVFRLKRDEEYDALDSDLDSECIAKDRKKPGKVLTPAEIINDPAYVYVTGPRFEGLGGQMMSRKHMQMVEVTKSGTGNGKLKRLQAWLELNNATYNKQSRAAVRSFELDDCSQELLALYKRIKDCENPCKMDVIPDVYDTEPKNISFVFYNQQDGVQCATMPWYLGTSDPFIHSMREVTALYIQPNDILLYARHSQDLAVAFRIRGRDTANLDGAIVMPSWLKDFLFSENGIAAENLQTNLGVVQVSPKSTGDPVNLWVMQCQNCTLPFRDYTRFGKKYKPIWTLFSIEENYVSGRCIHLTTKRRLSAPRPTDLDEDSCDSEDDSEDDWEEEEQLVLDDEEEEEEEEQNRIDQYEAENMSRMVEALQLAPAGLAFGQVDTEESEMPDFDLGILSRSDDDEEEEEDQLAEDLKDSIEEPMPENAKAQMKASFQVPIESRGNKCLGELVKFEVNDLIRCVEEPGAWVMLSAEQTNKTGAIAGVIMAAALMKKPCVVISRDGFQNVTSMADKLNGFLSPFETAETEFLAGSNRAWQKFRDTPQKIRKFKRGELVPVLPGYTSALDCLLEYLDEVKPTDVVLILDECDNMWTQTERDKISLREFKMYCILQDPRTRHNLYTRDFIEHVKPLFKSRIRSYVQISATHLSTVIWHELMKLPFKSRIVDKDELKEAGFHMPSDFEPFKGSFLTDRDAKKVMESDLFNAMLVDFDSMSNFNYDDINLNISTCGDGPPDFHTDLTEKERSHKWRAQEAEGYIQGKLIGKIHGAIRLQASSTPGSARKEKLEAELVEEGKVSVPFMEAYTKKGKPPKLGRLMQVCITSRMTAEGALNNIQVAKYILQKVKNVKCLVVMGKGVYLVNLVGDPQRLNKGKKAMGIHEAIPYIDHTYGLDFPVAVIGYACLVRCCSVRSKNRVITHALVNPADGQNMANMHQMFMRAAGTSTEVRHMHGFGKVKLLCREHDFNLLQCLYDFTTVLLRNNGNVDFTSFMNEGDLMADREDFVAVHNRIRESWRPYAPKALDAKVERRKAKSSQSQLVARYSTFATSLTPPAEASGVTYSSEDLWDIQANEPLIAVHKPPCDVIESIADIDIDVLVTGVMVFGMNSSLFKIKEINDFYGRLFSGNSKDKKILDNEVPRAAIAQWAMQFEQLKNAVEIARNSKKDGSHRNLQVTEVTMANKNLPGKQFGFHRKGLNMLFVQDKGAVIIYMKNRRSAEGRTSGMYHEFTTDLTAMELATRGLENISVDAQAGAGGAPSNTGPSTRPSNVQEDSFVQDMVAPALQEHLNNPDILGAPAAAGILNEPVNEINDANRMQID